jgi:cellobiose phosphorylase
MKKVLNQVYNNLRTGCLLNEGITCQDWQGLLDYYSHFNDIRSEQGYLVDSEVEIHRLKSPRPIVHLMASDHSNEFGVWGSFWDQFGGGFSFQDSVLAGLMTAHHDTNYVPTSPCLQDCRRFFIYEDGNAWSMLPVPYHQEAQYKDTVCKQRRDRFTLQSECKKLLSKLEVCVHPELPLELWTIQIANVGKRHRRFRWFSSLNVNIDSFPFYYFVPRVVCDGLYENNAMVFLNHDKNNKHPRHSFFASTPDFDRFDMMGEAFDGIGARGPIPKAVQQGSCTNSLGQQPYAGLVASAQFEAVLPPRETKTWTCVYGSCPCDQTERADYIENIKHNVLAIPADVKTKINNGWSKKTNALMSKTPSTDIDRYYNVWSKYQVRNQSRFCAALDKIGYRDMLQNLIGICDCDLKYVRTSLIRLMQYQLDNGQAVRQYEKIPGTGNDMRMYMDSSSWIPDTLVKYLKESGDFGLLDEQVPFFDMSKLAPDESNRASIYEHSLRAVMSLAQNTGFHGLCRIGYGDWNDALSGIGGEKGVSVWLSCACVHAADHMAELAEYLNKDDDASQMQDIARTMTERINNYAWDGQWYIYAINGEGKPIGSSKNSEGKIHLNVNTWALFTGVASAAGRENEVWDAIEGLATPFGHRLLASPYTDISRVDVGRIADQKPGLIENGSIYSHGEAFYLYALIENRRGTQCFTELMRTLPSNLVQDISTAPRHQQSNFTVGPDHPAYGTQFFSNFTGSVPWYRKVIERMLGVCADFDSLIIDPIIPQDWKEYEICKTWRGYNIRVYFKRTDVTENRIVINGSYFEKRIPLAFLSKDKGNYIEVEIPQDNAPFSAAI